MSLAGTANILLWIIILLIVIVIIFALLDRIAFLIIPVDIQSLILANVPQSLQQV